MSAAFSLARPLGLVALLIPLVYLLFVYHVVRPELRAVGSLGLWTRVRSDTSASAASTRWTWRTLVSFLALVAAALTLAGPRYIGPREPRVWTLVVGGGPAGALLADGARRVDRALADGDAFTRERPSGDRFVWVGASEVDSLRLELAAGEVPDSAFVAQLLVTDPSAWQRWDQPDCVWLPVSGAHPEPERAGLRQTAFAGQGGPVARTEAGLWTWEPASDLVRPATAEEEGRVATPSVLVEGAAFAPEEPLARFVEAWAAVRGAHALTIRGPSIPARGDSSAGSVSVGRVGRDGWTATAEWLPGDLGLGLRPFLSRGTETLVAYGPGLVETRLLHLDEPSGDPAAFAVSWAELFERAARPPAGIVALAERRAVEAARLDPGRLRALASASQQEESAPVGSLPLEAPLAFLAGLLFFLARR